MAAQDVPLAPDPLPEPNGAPAPPNAKRAVKLATWGTTGMLLVMAVIFIAIGATRTPPPPQQAPRVRASVETVTVRARQYVESLTLPAKIEADRRAVLSSELSGRLREWLVGENEQVSAGQILATIDTAHYEAELAKKQAELVIAQKGVAVAGHELESARVALERAQKDAAALSLDLESARANLELAGSEYERILKLSQDDIATPSDVDTARNNLTQMQVAKEKAADAIARAGVAVESARINVTGAEAALELARGKVVEADAGIAMLKVTLEKAKLRAPIAGKLEEHLVEAGEAIAAGTPLARIYDLSHVLATAAVPDRYVPFLDPANPAIAAFIARTLPGAEQCNRAVIVLPGLPKLTGGAYEGLELPATINRIAQAADQASNTFEVELRLVNPEGALKEGMIASARIEYLRYPAAITIPLRAVQVADVGPRVLVVEERDGRKAAAVRDIEPISIQEDEVLVGKGLKDGDQLVVMGGKGVVNGEEVNVIVSDGAIAAFRDPSAAE